MATDHGDPNWDSEVEDECNLVEEITVQLLAYKKAVSNIIFEYFNSGDVEETASSLEEIDHPELGYYFVKRAVTHSLDRHDKEREMVSILLSSLYDKVGVDVCDIVLYVRLLCSLCEVALFFM